MRVLKTILLAIPLLALSALDARDASACGALFTPPPKNMQSENTQVTGHRMIFSVSKTQTTLWDQIEYSGSPSSFAWVLPIKGQVDVGVSSDALFENLEQITQVTINSPTTTCSGPPLCDASASGGFSAGFSASSSGGDGPGGVTVIAQQVVGPYETVQISSQDPQALKTWLTSHNFAIPAEIDPVIAAYVADGFDFLALKLVPGAGIQAMKPVRVTTPGANLALPLRMVAAGTGTTTSISLWVLGEGAYVPANFPTFTIDKDKLVWDWDTMASNYEDLRQQGYAASNGKAWLVETSDLVSRFDISEPLKNLAMVQPADSGYEDDMGMGAVTNCNADIDALLGPITGFSVWVSRLHAELPHAALNEDLSIMASPNQATVPRIYDVAKTKGTAPSCPTYPPCDGGAGGANGDGAGPSGGCAVGPQSDTSMSLGIGVLAMSALTALRRRKGRAPR